MPMPPRRRGALLHIPRYFVEFGGHLHLIVIDKHSLVEFDIWELKINYSGWFVRYHVNLGEEFESFSVVCVARAEKEKELSLVLLVASKAISSFNLYTKTSKKLCDVVLCHKVAALPLDYQWFDAFQYIETLFHV